MRGAIAVRLVDPPTLPRIVELIGGKVADPELVYRYAPHSVCREFFSDNPRGYFHSKQDALSILTEWTFQNDSTDRASMSKEGNTLRVLSEAHVANNPGVVKLQHRGQTLRGGESLRISARCRSPEPGRRLHIYLCDDHHKPIWPNQLILAIPIDSQMQDYDVELPRVAAAATFAPMVLLAESPGMIEFEELALGIDGNASDVRLAAPYYVEYQMNSAGFRGPEMSAAPRPGSLRIACLGDSLTFGMGVHQADTFAAQLQRRLSSDGAMPAEVLNFGMVGYSTFEECAQYSSHVAAYRPQIVILTMYWNDHVTLSEEVELQKRHGPHGYYLRISSLAASRGYGRCIGEVERLHEHCVRDGARLVVVAFNSEQNPHWTELIETCRPRLNAIDVPFLELWPALYAAHLTDDSGFAHPHDPHPNEAAHRVAAQEMERLIRAEMADLFPPAPVR